MLHRRFTATLAALLLAGAVAPGIAGAREDINTNSAANAPASVTVARTAAVPAVVRVEAPASSGFDWGDALIGAGVLAAMALLVGGAAVMVQHHRHAGAGPGAMAH
jgi:hypothetical protein